MYIVLVLVQSMPRSSPTKLGHFLAEITAKHLVAPSDPQRLDALRSAWRLTAGVPLAEHATPVLYREGVLLLHVDSSIWLSKLRYERALLMERLQAQAIFADLREIKARLASSEPPPPGAPKRKRAPLSRIACASLKAAADSTTDPALSVALERLSKHGNSS